MTSAQLLTSIVFAFILGGAGSFCLLKNDRLASWWGSFWAIAGSLLALFLGAQQLVAHQALYMTFSNFAFTFRIDQLSGLFLMIIATIGVLATIYGVGYMRHFTGKYALGAFYGFYNFFLGSMLLVVTANHALFFLLLWEIMSLASYFLVVFEHESSENVRAGYLYIILTHIATALLVCMFFLLYRATGSFDFDVWRLTSSLFSPLFSRVIFLLALLGFGTKAGIIPLHIWLPAAHPAAPSQVSALMSGVMIKLGIFMLIRFYLDIFTNTPLWLGLLVLALGALSSVLGVLYALGEHDIKRLLAFHSIENIGIILLGIGAALAFRSLGQNGLALLGLAAALFHTVNHAIFKSLLFMSAGAVVGATHTRNIEEYGGLAKRMPQTAFFFLVGAIAICGIIPFNGFVSEWLTFQSLIGGFTSFGIATKSIFVLGVAALALTGGLAAACFVKAFGVTFLARPRSSEAAHAHEADMGMRLAMAPLALLALLFGIFGAPLALVFMGVGASLPQFALLPFTYRIENYLGTLGVHNGFGMLNMPFLFALLCVALFVTWLLLSLTSGKSRVVRAITWDCGFPLTPRMEITGTAFAQSIIVTFRRFLRQERHTEIDYMKSETGEEFRYFVRHHSVSLHLVDLYRLYVYDPVANAFFALAGLTSKIQNGSINTYLLYILITFAAVLFWALHA